VREIEDIEAGPHPPYTGPSRGLALVIFKLGQLIIALIKALATGK
jgi:hypothetical protein